MDIYKILNLLKETSSTKEKTNILSSVNGEKLLKEVVNYSLNPTITFGIKKIPEYSKNLNISITLEESLKVLPLFINREVTGNAAIALLKNTLEELSFEDAKVFESIILKDLKCGVSTATVNKVWKGLIPDYPIMLCEPNHKFIDRFKFPAYVQIKSDGMRFNAVIDDVGKISFHSRNGKEYDFLGNLIPDFSNLHMKGVVYDGELLVKDENGNILPRKTGNGIISKALKGTISEEEASRIVVHLWDIIDYEDWKKGYSPIKYKDRLTLLTDEKGNFTDKLSIIPTTEVNSLEEVQELFSDALAKGLEGVILKDKDSPWEDRRVNHQLKFKNEIQEEFRVIDWIEGTGKYKGMLGALKVQSLDGEIVSDVGTGFDDKDRKTIGKEVIGKLVTLSYNEVIADKKKNTKSLFLPVFIEIREDL